MNSTSNVGHNINWVETLKTQDSAVSFLGKQVVEMTKQLENQTYTLEETGTLHRIKWIAEIALYALRTAVFFVLEKGACLFRADDMERRFSVHLSDALLHIGSLVFRFKCADDLLIASHNSHDLAVSNLYLEQNIEMDGASFDTLQFWGKCWGMSALYALLFLKGREFYPDMPLDELVLKIGSVFQNGAPSEASIMQNFQSSKFKAMSKLFADLSQDFKKYCKTPEDQLKFKSWTITETEALEESPLATETLEQLEIGKPYYLRTRVLGLHANCLIRTGEKEFFWFDPNIGLCVFKGNEGLRRLPKMLGYEKATRKEAESQWLPSNAIRITSYFDKLFKPLS